MKKTILLVAIIATTLVTMAQQWKPVPVTPLAINDLIKVRGGYAQLGSKLYIAMYGTSGKTIMVSYDTVTQVYDTMPGGINLPIWRTSVQIGPDSTLWVVGSGTGCDSVIWRTHLSEPGPPPLAVLWGPRSRPNPGKYAWVENVGFLGTDVYFAGRWDSLGTDHWPNILRYSNQSWSYPAQASLAQVNQNANSGTAYGARFVKTSNPGELAVTLPSSDTCIVITSPTAGYVINASIPSAGPGTIPHFLKNAYIFYKNDLYYSVYDNDSATLDMVSARIIRRNHSTGSKEVIYKTYWVNNSGDEAIDFDIVHNYLLTVMATAGYRDTLSHQIFMPVMAFDSTQWTPVTDLFAQGSTSVFTRVEQGLFFGNAVTTVNSVVGRGFYRFDFVDTTAPVITLNGSDTIIVHKGSVFTDPGATASDNEDGNITSSIVVTGVVDTGTLGTYTITYTVTDAAGNTTSITRTVIVDHSSGIGTLDNPEMVIKVYPDRFVVSEVTSPATVRVFATTGQQVSEFGIMHQGTFSYTGLARGVYIASVGSKNFRFVVE